MSEIFAKYKAVFLDFMTNIKTKLFYRMPMLETRNVPTHVKFFSIGIPAKYKAKIYQIDMACSISVTTINSFVVMDTMNILVH